MNVWIIGCGKFGSRAVLQLLEKNPGATLTVVDPDPARLKPFRGKAELVPEDGIAFLSRQLKRDEPPDWIVAAAPIHVACLWVANQVSGLRFEPIPVPKTLLSALPNPIKGRNGEIFTSHADFMCPEDCPEPARRCTATGRIRGENMYTLFERLNRSGRPCLVIRSRLLHPGVGGYAPEALFQLKKRVEAIRGDFLVGTACRCHGVLHALRSVSVVSSSRGRAARSST